MVHSFKVIICDNQHLTGDVTFPDTLESAKRIKKVVSESERSGWGKVGERDYCPACMHRIRSEKKGKP